METICELAKTYQRIAKSNMSRLDIQYNSVKEMYVASLEFGDLPFWFKIYENGVVFRYDNKQRGVLI